MREKKTLAGEGGGERKKSEKRENEIHVVINRRHQGRRTTCEFLKNIHQSDRPVDGEKERKKKGKGKERKKGEISLGPSRHHQYTYGKAARGCRRRQTSRAASV